MECGGWICGRCVGVKRVTSWFHKIFLQWMWDSFWEGSGVQGWGGLGEGIFMFG